MKKECISILGAWFMVICMLTVFLPGVGQPMAVYAEEPGGSEQEATQISGGNYTISTDGDYQLTAGYTGIITIANNVSKVTIMGSAGEMHLNTCIVIAAGRVNGLELTINDLSINAPNFKPAIDFGSAGSSAHKLYISGISSVVGNFHAGINVPDGIQLTIDKDEDLLDEEEAQLTATGGNNGAGIGSGIFQMTGGSITITDGTVTATGGNYGAGIGGGYKSRGGSITITGGTVTANGGKGSSGIGGGYWARGGTTTITGGTVTATGGIVGGAGIGGGNAAPGGNITITGGIVNAIGGNEGIDTVGQTCRGGAGIGGGHFGAGGIIAIEGGIVTATGGVYGAAGIGGGHYKDGGIITISGGTVTAAGADYAAGIGGGTNGAGSKITIAGGTVTATGGPYGSGIGGGSGAASGNIEIIGTPAVYATGDTATGARHVGRGATGPTAGSLSSSGVPMSYLRFNVTVSSGTAISGAKIVPAGAGAGYLTNNQGISGIFVPQYSSATYIVSKAGYAAVRGTQNVTGINHDISIQMAADNTPTNIISVSPAAVKTGTTSVSFNNDYGIYGKLYLVPKVETAYTDQTALEAVTGGRIVIINSPETGGSIDTTGLDDDTYQVYLTDSASNVSAPFELLIDDTPPFLVSAARLDNTHITVTLSENCTGITKNNDGGFRVQENGNPDITYTVSSIAQGADEHHVVLTVTDMDVSKKKGVTVKYEAGGNGTVQDPIGNLLAADAAGASVAAWYTSSHNSVHPIQTPNLTVIPSIPVLISTTGTAEAEIKIEALREALSGTGVDGTAVVEIHAAAGAKAYEIVLPTEVLVGTSDKKIEIKTELASVTLPSDMLSDGTAGTNAVAALTVSLADTSKLPEQIQAQIGSRSVIELTLKLDGKITTWNNQDAAVTVKVPYKPTAEELANPENITVWYVDGIGNAAAVPSGRYDPETSTVSFTTTHFSKYAVVYVKKSFSDLGKTPWAMKQIEVLAAKGILSGRSERDFQPTAGITRAEFISALVRTLGVSTEFDTNFRDVKSGSTYYDEIGIAKTLGIANGTENNSFKPDAIITRQEMLVMAERALRSLKRISSTGTLEDLNQYSDRTQLAAYSINSIAALVKEGLIEGSNGKLGAGNNATRAEAAVFLYRIYHKQ